MLFVENLLGFIAKERLQPGHSRFRVLPQFPRRV